MKTDSYYSIPAVSHSFIKNFEKSPKHAKYFWDYEKQPTRSMQIGTATHLCALEFKRFITEVAECPDRRTKEGKEFAERNADKLLLTSNEMESVRIMGESLRSEIDYDKIELCEEFLTWECPLTSMQLKCKLDLYLKDRTLIDIKTTNDASYKAFSKKAWFDKYIRQLAFYRRGLTNNGYKVKQCQLLAIETTPPHAINLFLISEEALTRAVTEIDALLPKIADCFKSCEWPGFEYWNEIGMNVINSPEYLS